jgi:hypothetical protein
MISSMKKKISIAVLGVGVLATPCFAMFGEDIAYLLQIISQGRQMIQIGQQAKAQFEQAASFVRNPGGWRNLLSRGQAALDQVSNGSDNVALQRINESIRASQRVYTEISNQPPTLANMTALSALSLQQVKAKNEADQLQAELKIQEDIRIAKERELWGCISCTRRSAK